MIKKMRIETNRLIIRPYPEEFEFYNGEPYYLLTKEEYLGMVK